VDPWVGISRAVRYALVAMGHPVPTEAVVASFIGPPLLESFARVCHWDETTCRHAVQQYREYYQRVGIWEQHWYPGIPELLAALAAAGVQQVLATSKPTPYARDILNHQGVQSYFSLVVGSELDGRRARKSEVLAEARAAAGVRDPSRSVMVGDTVADVLAAHEQGIDSLAVSYGYGDWAETEGARPTLVAASVNELAAILLG